MSSLGNKQCNKISLVHYYSSNLSGAFLKRVNSTLMTEVSIQYHQVHNVLIIHISCHLQYSIGFFFFRKHKTHHKTKIPQFLLSKRHCLYNFINSTYIFHWWAVQYIKWWKIFNIKDSLEKKSGDFRIVLGKGFGITF